MTRTAMQYETTRQRGKGHNTESTTTAAETGGDLTMRVKRKAIPATLVGSQDVPYTAPLRCVTVLFTEKNVHIVSVGGCGCPTDGEDATDGKDEAATRVTSASCCLADQQSTQLATV